MIHGQQEHERERCCADVISYAFRARYFLSAFFCGVYSANRRSRIWKQGNRPWAKRKHRLDGLDIRRHRRFWSL